MHQNGRTTRRWPLAALFAALLVPALAASAAPPAGGQGLAGARGDDAGPPGGGAVRFAPGGGKPAVVAGAAVRSFDALGALARDTGVDLPPFLTAGGIEAQFPFLGGGSVDPGKPVGIVMFGGPGITMQNSATFLFPLKAEADPMKNLVAGGAKPVPGQKDVYSVAPASFRRTKDNFIFGLHAEGIGGLDEGLVTRPVQAPGTLLRAWVDVKAIRTTMPEQFKAFIDQIENKPGQNANEQKGAKFVADLVREKPDRVDLAVDQVRDGLRVAATVTPVPVRAPAAPLPRPGFPAGVVLRADIGFRPLDAMPGIDAAFWEQAAGDDPKNAGLTAAQKKQAAAAVDRIVKLFLGADAVSLGVEPVGDTTITHVVSQYRNPVDFAGQLKQAVADVQALQDKDNADDPRFETETYDAAGGAKVSRVKIVGRGKNAGTTIHLDALQRGNAVYMTFGVKPDKHVERLAGLKAGEAMKTLADGWVDLGGMVTVLSQAKDGPVAQMPAADRKQLEDVLKGRKLVWSATSTGNAMTFDLTVPQQLIKDLPKLAAMGGKQ